MEMTTTRRRFLAGAGTAVLGMASFATTAGTSTTVLEILHAAAGTPALDLYVDGVPLQPGLAFTQFSPRYRITARSWQLRVFPQGADPNGAPLITVPIALDANGRYLVALAGRDQQLEGVAYLEPAAPAAGRATLRMINLDPGAPPIDVVDSATNGILIGNVPYKAAKSATIPQANLALQLRQTGTANVLVSIAPTNFPERKISTIIRFAPDSATRARAVNEAPPPQLVIKRSR